LTSFGQYSAQNHRRPGARLRPGKIWRGRPAGQPRPGDIGANRSPDTAEAAPAPFCPTRGLAV